MKKAWEKFNAMMENLPKKYSNSSWLLRGLLTEAIGKKPDEDFQKAITLDDNSRSFLKNSKEITLELFPNLNRLCINFPLIEVSFKNHPLLVFVFKFLIENATIL